MTREWTLALSGSHHEQLRNHLYPGDGLEAAAILLCRVVSGERNRMIVYDTINVPLAGSQRSESYLVWPGEPLSDAIDRAEGGAATLILIHSHPGSCLAFSEIDNESDRITFPHIFDGWSDETPADWHGSAIMTPDGAIRARLYDRQHQMKDVDLVTVSGHDIKYFWVDEIINGKLNAASQPFFDGMAQHLSRLSVGIIGASGTGSIIAEQAARMGVGELTLIDFDIVEHKNLNRILNSKLKDAEDGAFKVTVLKRAIEQHHPDCVVHAMSMSIASREAVLEAAKCDVIFCCVDSLEGRHIVDQLAQAMVLPLFDVGVTIPTREPSRGVVVVSDALGRIDYIQPGRSTLASREVYSAEALRSEYLSKVDPDAYRLEAIEGYIKGAVQEAPSVIALNMRAAAGCMLEFITRAFAYRHDPNENYARTIFSLAEAEEEYSSESKFVSGNNPLFANGLREPLLGMPALSE